MLGHLCSIYLWRVFYMHERIQRSKRKSISLHLREKTSKDGCSAMRFDRFFDHIRRPGVREEEEGVGDEARGLAGVGGGQGGLVPFAGSPCPVNCAGHVFVCLLVQQPSPVTLGVSLPTAPSSFNISLVVHQVFLAARPAASVLCVSQHVLFSAV
ncbi:unnamed protein product [Danaus chrysippus]|uniref:(African queen) hypothetical protein n=1 Tax=Danaus chrysippus TaxID=151541 RepID=A0A8J2QQ65_9NEOP|nr:unnamed protein product [Danaus chrysippus]